MSDSYTEPTRGDVKRRAYQLNPEIWVSYSGKTRKEKRWIDSQRTQALDRAAREFGYSSYLSVPTLD